MATRIFRFCDKVELANEMKYFYESLIQRNRGKITLEEFRRAADYYKNRNIHIES